MVSPPVQNAKNKDLTPKIIQGLILAMLVFLSLPASQVWGQSGSEPASSLNETAFKTGPEVVTTLPSGSANAEFANLKPFGYEFFQSAATAGTATNITAAGTTTDAKTHTAATTAAAVHSAGAPLGQNIPVPMQYRVGPEDKISIVLGGVGGVDARHELIVDGNGRIDIPRIGSVFVGGMTFEEMSKQVIKKTEETAGVSVDISMNARKTFPVSVRGEVRWPGPHTVGDFATITDALFVAGGPSETGSVRNIQVKRKGIIVASFDLYDLLIKGLKSKDITLMAGDEVLVPAKGPAVGIAGSVRQPAIYELKGGDDLENLIGLAGGVIASPSLSSSPRPSPSLSLSPSSSPRPSPSSSLTPSLATEAAKPHDIQVTGRHIERPAPAAAEAQAQAPVTEGKQIKEAPRSRTQAARRIQVERIIGNERKLIYDVSERDLNQRKSVPPALQDRDLVRISPFAERSAAVAAVSATVPVVHAAATPTAAAVVPPVALDGSVAPSGDGKGRKFEQAGVSPGQSVPAAATPTAISAAPAAPPGKYVTLSGEFKRPGRYPIQKGEKLSSVIERAGGYTSNAYLRGAYFTRESVRQAQQQSLNDMADRVAREIIPPGEYSAAAATSLSNNAAMAAGGPAVRSAVATGDIGAGPTSISGRTTAATAAAPAAPTASAPSSASGKIKAAPALPTMKADELELKQSFVGYMKSLKVTGRLTITMAHLRLLKGSTQDVELEAGDKLHLPQNGNVVNVIGGVMSEGPHIYDDQWDYREYISAAGGYAKYADEPNVFAIKVDGGVRKLPRGFIEWSDRNNRWEVTVFGREIKQTEAGDVIVVPEKLTHIAWLKQVRDLNQLLMNTAVLTGTALRLW